MPKRPARKGGGRRGSYEKPPYELPGREWERGTELISMFVATGFVKNSRPQSLLLISEPGSGKTELVDRFRINPFLRHVSDITSRGLYPILKGAKSGSVTHLVASEFQKFLLRKSHTASATLGLLCQAMEEGVGEVLIGDQAIDFQGARLGVIGAITHDTVSKWRRGFRELGFWSRCAAFEWEVSFEEMQRVMRSISHGDKSDLTQVKLDVPDRPIVVEFPVGLSEQFEKFVVERFREHTVIRVFNRFRTLAMGNAILEGRDIVKHVDVEKVAAFGPYWEKMQK